MDELGLLLGDFANNETQLKKLMGDNKAQYEEKLRRRLEKRRQRIAEGKLIMWPLTVRKTNPLLGDIGSSNASLFMGLLGSTRCKEKLKKRQEKRRQDSRR